MNNNFYLYVMTFFLTVSLVGFFCMFFIFSKKNKLLYRNTISPLIFMDYCFYENSKCSNLSISMLIASLLFGGCVEYFKNGDVKSIYTVFIGILSIVLHFLYCRLFSEKTYSVITSGLFIKEFISEYKINSKTVLLWISRVIYILCGVLIFI